MKLSEGHRRGQKRRQRSKAVKAAKAAKAKKEAEKRLRAFVGFVEGKRRVRVEYDPWEDIE